MAERALAYDKGKLKYQLIPWEWEEEIAKLFTAGAEKYGDENWKLSLNTEEHDEFVTKRLGSLRRHYAAMRQGETVDDETGVLHATAIAWNAMCIGYYQMYDKRRKDDGTFNGAAVTGRPDSIRVI